MFTTVLIFIIVLGILVFVHELGHFVTAKKMGMKVEEFGFGFPPRAWSKKGKDGVVYSVNWIPLGGFVKIKGESGESRGDEDSFSHHKPWKRAIVLCAGVAMNFLLCAVLLSIGFAIGLPQAVDQAALEQGIVKDYKLQVVSVLDGKPAKEAGIKIGDVILSIDGQDILGVKNFLEYVSPRIGQTASYKIQRGEDIFIKEVEVVNIGEDRGGIGIGLVETGIISHPIHKAVWQGFKLTGYLTKEIVFAFGNILKNLVIGKPAGVQVAGPVGIAVLTGQVAQLGFIYILQFTALLSLNLAIINFMPFPALDGGRLLFLGIEKIRRKPVSQKIESIVHATGFAILMLLVIVITFQDVIRYSNVFANFIGKIIQ